MAHAPSEIPASATTAGDGIATGTGPVTVDAYIDFLCPYCRAFEQASGAGLDQLIADRAITLVYHPMAFLDDASTTRYSSRAGAASACAADGGQFLAYARVLFQNQPPEGGAGLPDDELIALAAAAGLAGPDFGDCVRSGLYLPWPDWVTQSAAERGVEATPTVLVNGAQVAPDVTSIARAAGIDGGLRG